MVENLKLTDLQAGLIEYVRWDIFEKPATNSEVAGNLASAIPSEYHPSEAEEKIYQQIQKIIPDYQLSELLTQIEVSFHKTLPNVTSQDVQSLLVSYQGRVKEVFFVLFIEHHLNCDRALAKQVVAKSPDNLYTAVRWAYAELMARQVTGNK